MLAHLVQMLTFHIEYFKGGYFIYDHWLTIGHDETGYYWDTSFYHPF